MQQVYTGMQSVLIPVAKFETLVIGWLPPANAGNYSSWLVGVFASRDWNLRQEDNSEHGDFSGVPKIVSGYNRSVVCTLHATGVTTGRNTGVNTDQPVYTQLYWAAKWSRVGSLRTCSFLRYLRPVIYPDPPRGGYNPPVFMRHPPTI